MPVLKNDAIMKLLNSINMYQFKQWKTYAADKHRETELEGEVSVLGALFWELNLLTDGLDIYERAANKEIYAKFTEILSTRFSAESDYGYVATDDPHQDDRKNGFRNGVQWVEKALAEVVIMP